MHGRKQVDIDKIWNTTVCYKSVIFITKLNTAQILQDLFYITKSGYLYNIGHKINMLAAMH
jgi:hypothetical protein